MMSNFYFPIPNFYPSPAFVEYDYSQTLYPQYYQPNLVQNVNYWPMNPIEQNYCWKEDSLSFAQADVDEQKKVETEACQIENHDSEEQNQEMEKSKIKICKQKYGRNLTSNIFRCLLKRITGASRFKKLTQKLIKEKNFQITYQKFIAEVDRLESNLKSYVKKEQIRRFVITNSQKRGDKEFCQIFRILARVYMKEEHATSVFHSKKISKQSRGLHFTTLRSMESLLR